jgi:hypothetical protein
MVAFSSQGSGWRAEATRDILVPLCEGMIAYEAGDYDQATELFWPKRHEIVNIGGSHAQRDLFAQIMCDAAIRSSNLSVARSLLSERVMSRGTRKKNWEDYAGVLDALGEPKAAAEARRNAALAHEAGV